MQLLIGVAVAGEWMKRRRCSYPYPLFICLSSSSIGLQKSDEQIGEGGEIELIVFFLSFFFSFFPSPLP